MTPAHPPRTFSHGWSTGASSPLWATRCRRESPTTMMTKNAFKRTRSYASSKSDFLLRRLTSPGLIPGPTNSFPLTSATASASSPSLTGTLLRTNSMAVSLSASYARKFRTIRGFPSESKLVTECSILLAFYSRKIRLCPAGAAETDLINSSEPSRFASQDRVTDPLVIALLVLHLGGRGFKQGRG